MEWLAEKGLGDEYWVPCFRGSLDSWNASLFKSQCRNKKSTVALIRKGDCLFGGFSDKPWEGKNFFFFNDVFLDSLERSAREGTRLLLNFSESFHKVRSLGSYPVLNPSCSLYNLLRAYLRRRNGQCFPLKDLVLYFTRLEDCNSERT